ncbi:hypothetical protein G3T36_12770 [Diaminobutyricibacter tongyongensis]|uniref:Uncharacterized protein n=1 Tax=Leifsonia tongyongensis TaxID=1268043 RepID=A0A6L9XZ68_9MICO|nr:hypothetical protein [Diaminobutyricibacter tongyongensis]NEN06739.1 hypothetical protein [Diaminobutyricibacter tongyongensis]
MAANIPDPVTMTGPEWAEFAHSFDGYRWLSGRTGADATPDALFHQTVIPVRSAWERDRLDTVTADEIRATLFYNARADRHAGGTMFSKDADTEDDVFQRALVAELRGRESGPG